MQVFSICEYLNANPYIPNWAINAESLTLYIIYLIFVTLKLSYVCSPMQDSDQRPVPNRPPILKSMPDFYITDRHLYLSYMSFFKFLNRRPILKSRAVSHFLKSTSNHVTDVCSNPNPTNKSAIYLRIRTGCRFEHTHKSDSELR